VLWLVPGLALTKSNINSDELTDKYPLVQAYLHCRHSAGLLQRCTRRNSWHW